MNAIQAAVIYKEFSKLSIIYESQDGLALHEETRRYLFEQWLSPQNHVEFINANRYLVEYFQQLSKDLNANDSETLERRRMFHLLGADMEIGFTEFEDLFRRNRRQLRFSECESLVKLVEEYISVMSHKLIARFEYQQGKLATDQRQWIKAENLFNHVLGNTDSTPELQIKTYNRLGMISAEQRQWQKAIELQQKALQLENTRPECNLKRYHILHDLGVVYRDSGDLIQAENLLNKSIELASKQNDYEELAVAYNSLGTLYRKVGEGHKAIYSYEQSLHFLNKNNEKFRSAQVYNNLGATYEDLREWEESELCFLKSLDIKQEAKDMHGQALTYNNLARVYQNRKLYKKAIDTSQRSIILFKETRDYYNAAVATLNLARLFRNVKEVSESRDYYKYAIELFEQSNAHNKTEEVNKELIALDKRIGFPWWIWLAIILFPIFIICLLVFVIAGI